MAVKRKDTNLVLTKSDLEYIAGQSRELFRPKKFRRICRIDSSVPEWAEKVTEVKIKAYGDVRPTINGVSDAPRMPSIDRDSNSITVFEFEAAYDVRYDDLVKDNVIGLSTPVEKSKANLEVWEQILENIAAVGNTGLAGYPTIPGLANNASISPTAASLNFDDDADPDTVLSDLQAFLDTLVIESKEIFEPNTLVLPVTSYRYIARAKLGDGTSDTILQALLKTVPELQRVIPWYKLETAGAGSVKRAICFDAVHAEGPRLIISKEMTENPPVQTRAGYEVGQYAKTAGVLIKSTKSARYLDGL